MNAINQESKWKIKRKNLSRTHAGVHQGRGAVILPCSDGYVTRDAYNAITIKFFGSLYTDNLFTTITQQFTTW